MITHAAGESASDYKPFGPNRFSGATAVVLGVDNEKELQAAEDILWGNHIGYEPIVESAEPYRGQLMALGLVPVEKESVYDIMRNFKLLHSLILDNVDEEC